MDISFNTAKLAKLCNSAKNLRAELGDRMAQVVQRRLEDLQAAETLEVMRTLPGRCHVLTQDRKGCLAVDLVHPQRLVFRPDHEPIPEMKAGGLDWKQVTAIEVVGIGNYH